MAAPGPDDETLNKMTPTQKRIYWIVIALTWGFLAVVFVLSHFF